jgi:ABC-type glycerol-3-phosphate transport system substrate-binding protein
VWGWEGTYEGIQSQIPAFNQKHPDVMVNVQTYDYDTVHTNLLNAIVAGTGAPDLCAIDVLRLTQYIDGLVDLSAHRAEYEDYFVPPTLDLGSYQGKLYGLSTDSEPVGVLYRKDIWDQYGISEEDIETWADLAEAGNKLNQDSGGSVSLYGMLANQYQLYEILAVEQGFSGYYFDETDTKVIVDDPKAIAAAEVMKQLWDSKGALRNFGTDYYDDSIVVLKSSQAASLLVSPAWFPFYLTQQIPEQSGKWRLMRAGDRARRTARWLPVPHDLRHAESEPAAGPCLGVRDHGDDRRRRPQAVRPDAHPAGRCRAAGGDRIPARRVLRRAEDVRALG